MDSESYKLDISRMPHPKNMTLGSMLMELLSNHDFYGGIIADYVREHPEADNTKGLAHHASQMSAEDASYLEATATRIDLLLTEIDEREGKYLGRD